ncbi:MAG: DNA repair protein RecO, partial [Tepidisphaeraceae bacterium]
VESPKSSHPTYNTFMPLAADRCICLRKSEYSETSQIVTLFSRGHGILRLIAKGAHRRTKAGASRFDGGIDLLDSGHAVFTGDPAHELGTLTEWKLSEGHLGLRQNLRALYLALYAAELLGMLIEERDPHERAFDALENLLPPLSTPRREEAFLAFELDLLRESGFFPELAVCVSCSQEPEARGSIGFSPSRGGVVCSRCESSFPDRINLDHRLLRLLRQMPAHADPDRLPRLTRHQTDPLNRLLAAHVEHALGRRLRMPPYILPRGSAKAQPETLCRSEA